MKDLSLLPRQGAILEGVYRYFLWRTWNPDGAPITFVLCNPSTADGETDDPTIRRCVGFAQTWGGGSVFVVNLFAYRSHSPQDLTRVVDPVGPNNTHHIVQAATQSAYVVVAWGSIGRYQGQDRMVLDLLKEHTIPLFCLGLNRDGSPKHPLYLNGATKRRPFL